MTPRQIITTLNLENIVSNMHFAVKKKSPGNGGFSKSYRYQRSSFPVETAAAPQLMASVTSALS